MTPAALFNGSSNLETQGLTMPLPSRWTIQTIFTWRGEQTAFWEELTREDLTLGLPCMAPLESGSGPGNWEPHSMTPRSAQPLMEREMFTSLDGPKALWAEPIAAEEMRGQPCMSEIATDDGRTSSALPNRTIRAGSRSIALTITTLPGQPRALSAERSREAQMPGCKRTPRRHRSSVSVLAAVPLEHRSRSWAKTSPEQRLSGLTARRPASRSTHKRRSPQPCLPAPVREGSQSQTRTAWQPAQPISSSARPLQ